MGSVWIAEDLHLGRRVALKFLSQDLAKHQQALERLAKLMADRRTVEQPTCAGATLATASEHLTSPGVGTPERQDMPLSESGYSPDGKLMFYESQKIGGGAMHAKLLITPANDAKTILHALDTPYGMQFPRFTPDSKAIAFLLTRDRATNIWIQDLKESAPRQWTKFSSGGMFAFDWSRDGKHLAFSPGQQEDRRDPDEQFPLAAR